MAKVYTVGGIKFSYEPVEGFTEYFYSIWHRYGTSDLFDPQKSLYVAGNFRQFRNLLRLMNGASLMWRYTPVKAIRCGKHPK